MHACRARWPRERCSPRSARRAAFAMHRDHTVAGRIIFAFQPGEEGYAGALD